MYCLPNLLQRVESSLFVAEVESLAGLLLSQLLVHLLQVRHLQGVINLKLKIPGKDHIAYGFAFLAVSCFSYAASIFCCSSTYRKSMFESCFSAGKPHNKKHPHPALYYDLLLLRQRPVLELLKKVLRPAARYI